MRRFRKAIAATALLAMTAAPAAATNQTASVDTTNSVSVAAVVADAQPFCRDECKPPQNRLAGAGTFVAR
jgi:hypothetical protein